MGKSILMLNKVLNLSPEEIRNSKITLNMTMGQGRESCLDFWLREGTVDFSYWSHYTKTDTNRQRRNYKNIGTLVFGFVRIEGNRYLLVTIGRITAIPGVNEEHRNCEYLPVKGYEGLIGRLIINIDKGNQYSKYVFPLKAFWDRAVAEQILPNVYNSKSFPGFNDFKVTYEELKNQIDFDEWKSPLSNVKGVYLLNDTLTGKKYVGSATGEKGLYSRWKTYLAEGYDQEEEQSGKSYPNSKLKKLVEKEKISYIKQYFEFSILEIVSEMPLRENAIKRENHWKNVLNTKNEMFGYNSN